MTYKRITSKSYVNNPYTDSNVLTEFNDFISELSLAGIYQTADVGQLTSATLPSINSLALSTIHNLGYLMFKIWDNSFMRIDIIFAKNAISAGFITFAPTIGFETDGTGKFIGNTMESKGTAYTISRGAQTNGVHETILYKSDNTFWMFYLYNRNSVYLNPAFAIFLSKTVDQNLNPIPVHTLNMVCIDGTTATPQWASMNQANLNIRAISKYGASPRNTTTVGGIGDELFCSVNTLMDSREDTNTRYVHRCYHPPIDGNQKVNYDMVAIRTLGIMDLKTEINIQSGGSSPRKFLLLKAGTDNSATTPNNNFAVSYGSILKPWFVPVANTYGLAYIWD